MLRFELPNAVTGWLAAVPAIKALWLAALGVDYFDSYLQVARPGERRLARSFGASAPGALPPVDHLVRQPRTDRVHEMVEGVDRDLFLGPEHRWGCDLEGG